MSALVASHDEDMVKLIGHWLRYNGKGDDVAHLIIALIESDEIKSNLRVTEFMTALKLSFPYVKTVGARQVQKSLNYLQNLSPNRKQYGKDEPEHCFAIDKIKTVVLMKNTANIN